MSRIVLSKSSFAVRRGVTKSAVSRWLRYGFISGAALTADGKMIVVAEAEAQLAARIDPGRGRPPRAQYMSASPLPALARCAAAVAAEEQLVAIEHRLADAERRLTAAIEFGDELMDELDRWLDELPAKLGLGPDMVEILCRERGEFRRRIDG
ncbi:MAG TPA: hypothetical protein VGI28_06440 [Stellaceae bacterium]|jgi:hypothetical protein